MLVTNDREVADKVLNVVLGRLSVIHVDWDPNINIGSYQNGREQGHSISTSYCGPDNKYDSIWIGFARNRNSDEIVVYFGKTDPMRGVTDEMYNNKYIFGYDEHDAAAKFIVMMVCRTIKVNFSEEPIQ